MMRPFSDVDLHAFLDGQVSPERRALIEAYLKATPAEAARVDLWRRQNEALRSVFSGAASEPVPLWLTIGQVASGRTRSGAANSDTGEEARARPAFQRRTRAASPRPWIGTRFRQAAVLACVAFVAGLSVPYGVSEWPAVAERWLPATPRQHQLERVAVRVLEAHRTFGIDADKPVEASNQPTGTLATWFRRHAGFPVRVPDLSRIGWTLKGGRIVPGDLGPAALMVYENAVGDRLSLMAARATNPAPADTAYAVLSGPALAWLDGPLGFGVATSKEGSWLSDNARDLYRAVYESPDD